MTEPQWTDPEGFEEQVAKTRENWKSHELVVLEEGTHIQAYYLKHSKEELRIQGCLLLFTPEGVVITGDLIPGTNKGIHAVGSGYGFDAHWFANHHNGENIARQFLKKEWDDTLAADELEAELEEHGKDYFDQAQLEMLNEVVKALWEPYPDFMTESQFIEALCEAGYDTGSGVPGYGYDPHEYALLVAIQRRFSELWTTRR